LIDRNGAGGAPFAANRLLIADRLFDENPVADVTAFPSLSESIWVAIRARM